MIIRFSIREYLADREFSFLFSLCQILGWSLLVRVDGMTYSFLGTVNQTVVTVNLTNQTVTPTRTIITGRAGPMQVNLIFLNPIEVRSRSLLLSMFTYTSS